MNGPGERSPVPLRDVEEIGLETWKRPNGYSERAMISFMISEVPP
jgi:hypothetical protein